MDIKELVETWFLKWNEEDYQNIPIAEGFKHTSPYGTVDGKQTYLDLIESNKDKFLNNKIQLHDTLYEDDRACARYTIVNSAVGFTMDVSEWFYKKGDLIGEIVAYYNIEGDISEERKLKDAT